MADKKYTEENLFFVASNAFKAFLLTGERSEQEVAIFLEEFLAPENSESISIHCVQNSKEMLEVDLKFIGKRNEHITKLFCELCISVRADKRLQDVVFGVYQCICNNEEGFF
jgi:hypothetical protein